MAAGGQDAASRLWWAVRRYFLLLLVLTGLTAGAAAALGPAPEAPEYRASSLVIARELRAIRPEHLPRMAQAIFTGGAVAEEAVARGGLPMDDERLIPDFALLEPIEGTVLVRVVGMDEDPQLAADIANAAAEALVTELNRAGPEVGTFAVQEPARTPEAPEPSPLRIPPVLMGLVAGVILSAGLVGLLMVLRRPVLSGGEASAVTEAPLLGSIALSRRGGDPPERVHGMSALLKRLYPGLQGIGVFVSPRGGMRTRSAAASLAARALARSAFVCFVPAEDRAGQRAAGLLKDQDRVAVSADLLAGAAAADVPVVIDGPSADALDIPQFLPADARPVLVVREGTRTRVVSDASSQFLPGELEGVLFVTKAGRRARRSAAQHAKRADVQDRSIEATAAQRLP